MALLSQAMRAQAFNGSPDSFFTAIAGQQGRAWTERTVRSAYHADPRASETLRRLDDLRRRGVITDPELERLRAQLRV